MENTLNSQGQIQKTKEELVLDELYSYCSTSKASLIVKLFKIRGIFNKLDEIKYPSYFLYMLNEKSAVEEEETPEKLYLNSHPYNGEWNYTGRLVGYEYLVSSYGLMYRLTRHSFSVWFKSAIDKIDLYFRHLNSALKLFLVIPFDLCYGLSVSLLLIAHLFPYLKAIIICAVIKSKVKSKSSRDENSYETALREQFSQTIDNTISDETKRAKIKTLYNEIMSKRKQNGRPDDKLFGELLSNEAYQKNLLCIMELICTTSDPEDHNTLRDILSKKTTDSLLELCRSFDSADSKNSKINVDKMMLMHETTNEVILSSISNTCKVGDVFLVNIADVDIDRYISLFDSTQEYINQCTELIKYFQQKKLEADGTGRKIKRICRGIRSNKHLWSKVRDRFGLNVFNMCIRGKGSDNVTSIDTDPANNLLARLNDGLNNDDKLKIYTPHKGTYFLFGQVTKSKDGDYETSYRNSVLADRGKRITKRVLNLFLPPDYRLEDQNGKMLVKYVNASEYKNIADDIDKAISLEKTDKAQVQLLEKLSNVLDEWVAEIFSNGLPDKEDEFREKFETQRLSTQNKELLEKVLKSFNEAFKPSVQVDKNKFVDMLATVLYKYTESIHMVGDKPHPKEERDDFLKNLRSEDGFIFSPIDTIKTYAPKYFKYLDEVETVRQGISDASKYKLPGNFFSYNEDNVDCMCTALNYIQVLIQSAIAIVKIDTADEGIKIRFNRNVDRLVMMFENETQEADGDYQDLKTKIEEIVLNNPDAKKQEIFVKLLLDGVMDYSENQIQEICDMARKFTDFDLDNPTREYVTQINCVRTKKDAQGNLVGCKFDTKGVLSVEVPDDFQPPQDLQEDLHAQDDVDVLGLLQNILMNLRRTGLNIPSMEQIINNHLRNDD